MNRVFVFTYRMFQVWVFFEGGYIFNTEAHPIDPAALECCSGASDADVLDHLRTTLTANRRFDVEFKGDTISARLEEIETRRRDEATRKKLKELELQRLIDERHKKEREALRRKKELEEIRRQKKLLEASEVGSASVEELFVGEDDETSTSNEQVTQIGTIEVVEKLQEVPAPIESNQEPEQRLSAPGANEPHDDEPKSRSESLGGSAPVSLGSDAGATLQVELTSEPILNPHFSGAAPPPEKIETGPEPPVLIKKQSKDEATEPLATQEEIRVGENLVPTEPMHLLEALNKIVNAFVPLKTDTSFNLEQFRDRVFLDSQYSMNRSWALDHTVLACPAKHFLERFSIQGEFFENYD